MIDRIGGSAGTLVSGEIRQLIDDGLEGWPRMPSMDHAVDILDRRQVVSTATSAPARQMLVRVGAMLARLAAGAPRAAQRE